MEKPVLVTGAEGFTGQYLIRELESQGYDVVGLGNGIALGPEKTLHCDITNKEAVMALVASVEPSRVIHLAAMSFVNDGNIDDIYRVNILGTRNLLESLAMLNKTPGAVLLASSANVYGGSLNGKLCENSELAPVNDYGVSKLAMEYMARLWMGKLPIIITRAFNYIGIGQSENFLVPKIVSHFKQGKKTIELGNIDIERDFSDVRVVAQVYRKLVESNNSVGRIFNVCSGAAYSLNEIIKYMEDLAGYKIEVKVNSDLVRQNEIKRLLGNNELLHSVVGKIAYPEIKETLRWMYEGK